MRVFVFSALFVLLFLTEGYLLCQIRNFVPRGRKRRYYLGASLGLFFLMMAGVATAMVLRSATSLHTPFRALVGLVVFFCFSGKLCLCLLLTAGQISFATRKLIRIVARWGKGEKKKTMASDHESNQEASPETEEITRGAFLAKAGTFSVLAPLFLSLYGTSQVHDYKIWRHSLSFPNLPAAFDGIKILQLSDIHTGSFHGREPLRAGVEAAMAEKPDVIFFTGDLVNHETKEVRAYFEELARLQAPLGVYTVLGNHDYGDYKRWKTPALKEKNLNEMVSVHQRLGWRLLRNGHHPLTVGGDRLAILGTDNWSKRAFSKKYGKIERAHRGTESLPFKILLSHDPSHWDAVVRRKCPDVDLTLSGHTHGAQFGVEVGGFRWSPAQYLYEQWAGLYKKGTQYLYVNRGFGYVGIPIRVGIPPEITVMELKKDRA